MSQRRLEDAPRDDDHDRGSRDTGKKRRVTEKMVCIEVVLVTDDCYARLKSRLLLFIFPLSLSACNDHDNDYCRMLSLPLELLMLMMVEVSQERQTEDESRQEICIPK